MAAQERIVFTVSPAEKGWFNGLVEKSEGKNGNKIDLFRRLLDEEADRVGYEPRPK